MTPPDFLPAIDGLDAARLIAGALTPVSSPAFAWEPPPVEEVASWFPGYEVQALAGRGSMGAVYRAVQRKLERSVAIKLLPPAIAAREGAIARFEREARAMAQLNHPHTASASCCMKCSPATSPAAHGSRPANSTPVPVSDSIKSSPARSQISTPSSTNSPTFSRRWMTTKSAA